MYTFYVHIVRKKGSEQRIIKTLMGFYYPLIKTLMGFYYPLFTPLAC